MKIGIYGGTFSPIHVGHIAAAKSFLSEMALDKLYVIPTCVPPHKEEIRGADANERLEMCRLAFDGEEKISVSDIEIKRRGKSYTVDTLRALKDDGELYLLCGSDMFLTLESWREADEIFKLAGIVLGRRENDALTGDALEKHKAHLVKDCGARVFEIKFDAVELSSSEIRENIRLMRPIKDELLPSVRDYIYENGLYRDGDMPLLSNVRERVRTMMGKRRFLHTLGVEREINFLAGIYCPEKREKLRLAALLHDITKEYDTSRQLELCGTYGIEVDERLRISPKLFHAQTGAYFAKTLFGDAVDEEVFGAVRYHTLGRAGMSLCEMLLYLADYIDDTRRFDDCVELRKYFYDGLSKAKDQKDRYVCLLKTLILSFDMTVSSLEHEGAPVDSDTLEARDYIRKELEKYTG